MTIRSAIYARVSSAAQRDQHTMESQLHELRPLVERMGGRKLVGEFVDDGFSAKTGKLNKRAGYAQLLAAVAAGEIDEVVTFAMDRLTRTEDLIELAAILGPLQRAGVRIVSPTTGEIDLRSEHGPMIAFLQAHAAALENARRAARVKAGKLRAIAEGRKPAGPTPYGWTYSRELGTWSINEPAAAIQREIFRRVARGESCVQVADDLVARDATPAPRTGWTRAAVYRIVRKRTAVGEWDADKAKGAVIKIPPIITEDEWQAASRALLAHKRRGLVRTKNIYLLEGLAKCWHCGGRIDIRSRGSYMVRDEKRYNPAAYVCRNRKMKACDAVIVRCNVLDARVWTILCDEVKEPGLLKALAEAGRTRRADEHDWQADADGYRAHIARLEKVEAALVKRFRRGTISEAVFDSELEALGRERKAVREQLATAERAMWAVQSEQVRVAAATDMVTRLREALPRATPEQRRALLHELALDGGVQIKRGRALLDLRILRSSGAVCPGGDASGVNGRPQIALARPPGYRTQHEAMPQTWLRLRLVA